MYVSVYICMCIYSIKIDMKISWFVFESEGWNFCCMILGKSPFESFIILGCYYHILVTIK